MHSELIQVSWDSAPKARGWESTELTRLLLGEGAKSKKVFTLGVGGSMFFHFYLDFISFQKEKGCSLRKEWVGESDQSEQCSLFWHLPPQHYNSRKWLTQRQRCRGRAKQGDMQRAQHGHVVTPESPRDCTSCCCLNLSPASGVGRFFQQGQR